ncbi:hypothetical protein MMC26_002688 [Xylographa opegraphella]|nr:hypothetical protein [Xylographa opegraphella]
MPHRSFRVIPQGGERGRQYYYDIPPPGEGFDFHEPHPSSPHAYLDQVGESQADRSSSDRVTALPKEIRDRMLANLGIMDLDAARCTCKTWWNCITTNVGLLQSVLLSADSQCNPRQSRLDKCIRETSDLQRLNVEFQKAAKVLHHLDDDRSWKQNFRAVDVGFGLSSSQLPRKQTIEWMSYWNPVRVVILLVKPFPDLRGDIAMTEGEKRIVFYSLNSCGRPSHLGSVSCPEYVNELEVVGLGHDVLSRSFNHPILLRSPCHTWLRGCRVEPRAQFANTESFLKLIVVPVEYTHLASVADDSIGFKGETITDTEQCVEHIEAIGARDVIQSKIESGTSLLLAAVKQDDPGARVINDPNTGKWVLLREMDTIELYSTDQPCRCSERLIVAKHIATQQLHLVMVRCVRGVDSIPGNRSYTVNPTIRIFAPKKRMVFRNLSVCYASKQWCPQKFRMVISWVDPWCPSSPAELFLYKVKPGDSLRHTKLQALRQIRISTVPLGLGGLHKESPLRQLHQSIWTSNDYTDGGLALNPKVNSDLDIESNIERSGSGLKHAIDVQSGVQIVMSGVSRVDGKAHVRLLDLSPHFDDPWGSTLTDGIIPNGSKAILSDHTANRTYKGLTCTCPMHDLTYSVGLPEESRGISGVLDEKGQQSVDDFKLFLPRGREGRRPGNEGGFYDPNLDETQAKLSFSQIRQNLRDNSNGSGLLGRGWTASPDELFQGVNRGTVVEHTAPHRAAGLERLEKRGQLFIQRMRDDGLSDEEIANWWFNARWCWWNLLPKPAGWRRAA